MRRGTSLQSVFYSPETSTAFPTKKVPGKSPGPDTSITILRLCRFCSELLFIIHSKHKKQLRHAAFLFCIFHTVLLPERFADHRSAFTFGTHFTSGLLQSARSFPAVHVFFSSSGAQLCAIERLYHILSLYARHFVYHTLLFHLLCRQMNFVLVLLLFSLIIALP